MLLPRIALPSSPTSSATPEWVADLKEVHVLESDDEGRPVVVSFSGGRLRPVDQLHARVRLLEGSGPVRLGATQRRSHDRLDGFYRFAEAPGGGTEITYKLVVELRVPLPGFIKRRAEGNILHAAIRDLKARVESEG